jgi:hypothetical protein
MAAIGRIDANQGPFRAGRENAVMSSETQRRWRPPVISHRLLAIMRQRIVISATLANRRAEAAKQVVDFSRWFNGNGELDDLTDYDDPIRTTFAR